MPELLGADNCNFIKYEKLAGCGDNIADVVGKWQRVILSQCNQNGHACHPLPQADHVTPVWQNSQFIDKHYFRLVNSQLAWVDRHD